VVDTYNVAVEIGLNGPQVNLIKESTHLEGSSERIMIANVPSGDGIPYFHSFGLSKNYAVIVFQPLRLDVDPLKMVELGFLRSMQHVDHTRIVVVELDTGNVVLDQSIDEKIYYFHSISTAELQDNGDNMVSLRLCAYKKPDQLTGEHQFMRLEQAKKGLDWRSKIDKGGTFCDVNCNLNSKTVQVEWKDEFQQGFELPITRYSRSYNGVDICPDSPSSEEQMHPRYVYSFGAYALGSPDYDNWGLFKFDLEENQIAGYCHHDSVYISEPVFVADPEGTREDDGVLLTHAYFGEERQTKLLVLDATTMNVMATVATGSRAPLDVHGAWLPSRS
jgi:carotenoid cleavage dioxygenase-like enzyme